MHALEHKPLEQVLRRLPTLETGRLLLRRATLEDAEAIYSYARDPEIGRYVYAYPFASLAHAVNFVRRLQRHYAEGEPAEWVLEHRLTHRVIGTCGYTRYERDDRRAELGFILDPAWQRQGLMREALREVLRFSFYQTHLNRLEARCVRENLASAQLLRSLGFEAEGLLRQHIYLKNQFQDIQLFGLLRGPYLQQTSLL